MKLRLLCILIAAILILTGCATATATGFPPQEEPSKSTTPVTETPPVTEVPPVTEPDTSTVPEPIPVPEAPPLPEGEKNDPQSPAEPEEAEPSLLKDYLSNLASRAPVKEYGEDTFYTLNEDGIAVSICYPTGSAWQLEPAIKAWIADAVEYCRTLSDCSIGLTRLTLDYDSRLIGDAIVSIKFYGELSSPALPHPMAVTMDFNASLGFRPVLSLDKVLSADNPDAKEELINLVAVAAGIDPDRADASLLNCWRLTADGLEVTMHSGFPLTLEHNARILRFSHDELANIISVSALADELRDPVIDPEKPMLALTFDDGPSADTDRLLNYFRQYGGKGTFFVIGNIIDNRPDTLRRAAEEGHEIGGHSWNHKQLTTLTDEEMYTQLTVTREEILSVAGVETNIMRPPYGAQNARLRAVAAECGIALVNWSVDTLDWKTRNADKVYDAVMSMASDGAIILCHDLHRTTVDAMERVIPDLIAQGYQLVTVSQLLTIKGDAIEPGTTYYKLGQQTR